MLENMALNIGEYKNHEKYLEESIIVVDKMYENDTRYYGIAR